MDEKLKKQIEEFRQKAQKIENKNTKVTLASGGETSLGKVIKTKEQAHIFMTILNSLSKKS